MDKKKIIEIIMIVPLKIEIQLTDFNGNSKAIPDVFFGLQIFRADNSRYNYSLFKTNRNGLILLSNQEIIENAQLNIFNELAIKSPTTFSIYFWDPTLIGELIVASKRIAETSDEQVSQELLIRGFAAEDIPDIVKSQNVSRNKDKENYEFLKNAKNKDVNIKSKKVEGVWIDDLPKRYEFIIED